MILDQESREKVRTGVQSLLQVINTIDSVELQASSNSIQSKAQQALAQLSSSSAEEVDSKSEGT